MSLQFAFEGRLIPFFLAMLLLLVVVMFVGDELIMTKGDQSDGSTTVVKANRTSLNIMNHTIIAEEDTEQLKNSSHVTVTPEKLEATTESNNVTIVIQLSGEMGNQLSKIAYGRAVQLWAKEKFGIDNMELVFRAQEHPKWHVAMLDTKACFPNMRPYDFRKGNTEEFKAVYQEQKKLLGESNASLLHMTEFCTEYCINEGLSYLQRLLHNRNSSTIENQAKANISLPFLYTEVFSINAFVTMDKYYNDLRQLFAFDDEACCKLRPDPDESVFHLRNFRLEMPKVWNSLGFVELSPNKTAKEIFGHLNPGDKVAITTRIGGPLVQEYVTALESRGLSVRLIEGQSPLEDFCFLLHTQKELVGMIRSTYAVWAGYLSNAKRVRLYSVDCPSRRKRFGDKYFVHYNWTNNELKSKVVFELYKSEETDEIEAQARFVNRTQEISTNVTVSATNATTGEKTDVPATSMNDTEQRTFRKLLSVFASQRGV